MKTVIDLNDDVLALAAKELGTTTKKDTVNRALEFVAGYSARNHEEVQQGRPVATRAVCRPADHRIDRPARSDVQGLMAARDHHRAAGAFDLLTAAVAEHYGAVMMHYEADFEHIAASTGQPHTWVQPKGTID